MPRWINPTNQNTMYLFYQGRGNSQAAVSRFLGRNRFYTTTGEVSYSKKPILTMPYHKVWLYPEIDEINKTPPLGGWFSLRWLKKTEIIVEAGNLNYQPLYPTNETGSLRRYTLRSKNISTGQNTDIQSHKKRFDALMDKRLGHPLPDNVVLYGPSRGAATSFVALAKYKNVYKNIKLCVLEAPWTSYTSLAKYFFGWIGKWLYRLGILKLVLGWRHQVSPKQQPKAYVKDFPDDVPLVVFSSKLDKAVPHKSSLNLALAVAAHRIKKIAALGDDEVAKQNIMPVYFIQLDNSQHTLSLGRSKDKLRYQRCLHAIYKKHNLPYVKEYAEKCDENFEQFELTRGVLAPQVSLHDLFKKTKIAEDRKKIQIKALCQLKTTHTLRQKNDDRALEICKYMAPYRKSTPRFCFFGQPTLQQEVTQLQSRSFLT